MKTEFSSRFDGVMVAIENMRRKTNDCTEPVSQPQLQISNAEDDAAGLLWRLLRCLHTYTFRANL